MADTQRLTDAQIRAELAPLVRVIASAIQDTPIRLGGPEGTADLTATIAVRVAAYVGREVLPPPDAETKKLRLRADIAEAELRTLRAGIRSLGGDPTTIQNLWAQISLRNRQWKAARDANTRVRLVACDPGSYEDPADVIRAVCKALDGPEHTEQPC
ncbi:hypothetical protein [Streptomyces bobili]|uniref:hypothetical protein n=1 Tax=Streptomyces bobili TaxID=67280 RepID=UPI000A3BF355|nr:hypothetical protein [Streptomyces bobili]